MTIDLSQTACDARLRASLLDITEHPEHWEQACWVAKWPQDGKDEEVAAQLKGGGWPCGTVACLAGNGAVRAGMVEFKIGDGYWLNEAAYALLDEHDRRHGFRELAALLFGIDELAEQMQLFDSDNTLLELWNLAELFTAGRVTVPIDLVQRVVQVSEEMADSR